MESAFGRCTGCSGCDACSTTTTFALPWLQEWALSPALIWKFGFALALCGWCAAVVQVVFYPCLWKANDADIVVRDTCVQRRPYCCACPLWNLWPDRRKRGSSTYICACVTGALHPWRRMCVVCDEQPGALKVDTKPLSRLPVLCVRRRFSEV